MILVVRIGTLIWVLALLAAAVFIVSSGRGCAQDDRRSPAAHDEATRAADTLRAAALERLAARAARADSSVAVTEQARRLSAPARSASGVITRVAAMLPVSARDTIAAALAIKDSLEAAQAAVIKALVLDTTDLAAATRHALAADSFRAVADSFSVARAKAAEAREKSGVWRGVAIGASGAAAVIGLIILITGAR